MSSISLGLSSPSVCLESAAEFHDAVLSRGRAIPAEAMEGQTFSGKQAQRHNLAGTVPDRAEAMRRLKVYHTSVDTKSPAMTTALEDQLLEARPNNRVGVLCSGYFIDLDQVWM